jgi:PAS domain S-box-containing protein
MNNGRDCSRELLLVEDEAIVALHHKMLLQKHGYGVVTVHSGEEAVAKVENNTAIDLVLMDIDLGPGISGDVAAERILESCHLPIVFLTSHSEKEYVDRVKKITRYGYVLKNSGEFVLWDTIEVAFELFEAYQSLWEREEQYRALFFNSHSPMMLIRPHTGEIVAVNPAACDFYGWDHDAFVSLRIQDINELSEAEVLEEMQEAWSESRNYFVFQHRRSDNETRTVEVRSSPIYVEGEKLLYSIIHDVTDRLRAEHRLRYSEQRYRDLVELAPTAIFRTTSSGRPLMINQAMAELLGFETKDEALEYYQHLGLDLYVNPERRKAFIQQITKHGSVYGFEYEAYRRDGSTVWLRMNARRTGAREAADFEIEGFTSAISTPQHP